MLCYIKRKARSDENCRAKFVDKKPRVETEQKRGRGREREKREAIPAVGVHYTEMVWAK
jgi:hypothetical protein